MPRIVVIGAGPAGTVAAICLARHGSARRVRFGGPVIHSPTEVENNRPAEANPTDPAKPTDVLHVTLIEQHRFPRDKVCGECLSALGIEVLSRLGLGDRVSSAAPAILQRAIVHGCDGEQAELGLPAPMWGISRLKLDAILLDAARASGVHLLQPARCEAISPQLRLRMLDTNELRTLDADFVIVADGKGALLPGQNRDSSHDLGLKAHFQNIAAPLDAIGLFGVNGHYGGIAPIEEGLWNIAFSVPAARFKKHLGNLDALFWAIVGENISLSRQMSGAQRVGDWLVSPLPRFAVARNWPQNVIPIGNSAAALEPIGGEGIGLAMRSAELAADAILDAISSGSHVDAAKLGHQYRKLWAMRRFICRMGGRVISSPVLARLAIPFAARSDGPAALAMRLIGK